VSKHRESQALDKIVIHDFSGLSELEMKEMEQEINKWSRPANPRPFLASRPTAKFRRFRRHHQHAISLTDPNPLQILRRNHILDPDRDVVTYWKHVFLITLIVALFIDPLYFFLPYVGPKHRDRVTHSDVIYVCLSSDRKLCSVNHIF